MFNDTEEMFSYPAPVPLVGNMATLKNIKDINTDFRAVELEHLPARIFVDSFPFASGNIEVMPDEEIEDSTTLNITAARQSFADLIGDMKCSDVNIKDEIVIGEKIGNVHVDAVYTYTVNAKIGKSSSWTLTKRNNEISGDFEPQALGFSYPAQCEVVDDSKQVAVQDSVRSYPNNKSVVIPKVKVSYINTSAAYGETMQMVNLLIMQMHVFVTNIMLWEMMVKHQALMSLKKIVKTYMKIFILIGFSMQTVLNQVYVSMCFISWIACLRN